MKNPLKKAGQKAGDLARTVKKAVKRGSLDTGDPSTPLGERTRQQLYNRARELDIPGRSKMNKGQLVAAIRRSS